MSEDLISKYIDRVSFAADTKFAIAEIESLYKTYIDAKKNLDASSGTKNISSATVALSTQVKGLTAVIEQQTQVIGANSLAQKKAAEDAVLSSKQKIAALKLEQQQAETSFKLEEIERKKKEQANKDRIAEINREIKAQEQLSKVKPAGKVTQEQKLQNTISTSQLGSYDQLNAKLKLAVIEYNKLSEAGRNSDNGKKLQGEIISLDVELKKLDADVGKFNRNVGNYKDGFSGFANIGKDAANKVGDSFKNMAKNIAASVVAFVGIQSIFSFFKQGLEIFEKSEVASARLENSLKNVGGTSKDLKILTEQSKKLREQFQYIGATDLKELQQKLVVFGKLSTEQIGQASQTIIDFAANQRITIPEATDVYTKALEGSARALKQYGINIKDAKTEGERFALLQNVLGEKVKGAAAVFAESAEGKIEAYSKKLNGLKKTIGEQLFPVYESFLNKSESLIEVFKKAVPALAFLASNILYIAGAYLTWRSALLIFNTVKAVSIAQSYAAAVASGEEAIATQLASKQTLIGTVIYNLAAVAKRAWAAATAFLTTEIRILNTSLAVSPIGIFLSLLGLGILLFSSISANAKSFTKSLLENSNQAKANAETQKLLAEATAEAGKAFGDQLKIIDELTKKATDQKISLEERGKALKELKSLDEDYLKGLNLENIATDDGRKILEKYTEALRNNGIAKALESKKSKIYGSLADLTIQTGGKDVDEFIAFQTKLDKDQEERFNKTNKGSSPSQRPQFNTGKVIGKIVKDSYIQLNLELDQLNALQTKLQNKSTFKQAPGLSDKLGTGDGDKSDKNSKEKSIADLKVELNTEFEIYKLNQARLIELYKEEANDPNKLLSKRLDALNSFFIESKKLIGEQEEFDKQAKTREAQREIDNLNKDKKGKSGAQVVRIDENIKVLETNLQQELLLIEAKGNDERNKAGKLFSDTRTSIVKSNGEKIKKIIEDTFKDLNASADKEFATVNLENEKNRYVELQKLDNDFKAGKIKNSADYEKQKSDIEARYNAAEIQAEIEKEEKLRKNAIAFGNETVDIDAKIVQLKIKQLGLEVDATKKAADAKLKIEEELAQKKKELLTSGKDAFVAIVEGQFDKEKNRLADAQTEVDKKKERDLAANEAIVQSEEKKAANIIIINTRAQVQKEALDRRQKKVDHDKAVFDRAVAVAQIIANTAIAITKDLIGNKFLIPFDIAIGAAQLIAVLAKPIPKFKDGKNNDYEGPAIVGDGGVAEYIERADGSLERTPARDTLTHLGKDDIVYPNFMAMMLSRAMPALPSVKINNNADYKSDLIHNELKKISHGINIVANKRENHLSAKDGALVSLWKHGANQTKYFDENTNW